MEFIGPSVTYEQFLEAFKSILSHQSEYFRAIYNNQDKEIDYGLLGKFIYVSLGTISAGLDITFYNSTKCN